VIRILYHAVQYQGMQKHELACGLLDCFARETGLEPAAASPRRYLWTDAFAVCTYLGLYRITGRIKCRELALHLIGQVHHTLGRHRSDDARRGGWISGRTEEEGEQHPAAGGLRIGKPLPERGPGEPYDEQEEWDRDGQYFHYLTRWMHTLATAGEVTGNAVYTAWAVELARAAHARFMYLPARGQKKRMYWKMSIDLSRPLVPSMGQHDPLDGFVTFWELQRAAGSGAMPAQPVLAREISEMAEIGRGLSLATSDPLGTGGLLSDAAQIARLADGKGPVGPELLEQLIASSCAGLEMFADSGSLELPARYRLAFRELGLSIGLAGVEYLPIWIQANPHLAGRAGPILLRVKELREYLPLRDAIEVFWLDGKNQASATWTSHRDINTVMLAASLAPEGYLGY
jgi:hypothetical protein